MARILSFLTLLFHISMLFAQNPSVLADQTSEWNGVTLNKGDAKILHANQKIIGFELDSVNQLLYMKLQEEKNGRLKPKGSLVCYDLSLNNSRWEKEMNYNADEFILHDTLPILASIHRSHLLDRVTGKEVWTSSVRIEFSAPGQTIGLGSVPGNSKPIIGVDLTTGIVIWNYSQNRIYDLESVTFMGDTAMVISSKGIHYLELATGAGFFHKAKTDGSNFGNTAVVMGAILGGMIGATIAHAATSAAAIPGRNVVGNIKSNVEIFNNNIFFADFKELTAVDTKGKLLWSSGLPNGLKSLSKVFMHNDMVYVINNGVMKLTDGNIYGEIYLSKWNPETGDLEADLFPGKIKEEHIHDFIIRDETIVLALNNRMAEYSLDNFELLNEKSFGNPTISSGLQNIVSPPYYLITDDKLENRTKTNPKEIYIENSNGMKIAFSPELEITSVVRKPNFYSFSQYAGPWMILENGTNSIVINEKNEVLNEIPFSNNLKFINGYFFDFNDDKFIVAPADIIEN